jgi:hypothetical protein
MLKKTSLFLFAVFILVLIGGIQPVLFSQENEGEIEEAGSPGTLSNITGDVQVQQAGRSIWVEAGQGQAINIGDKVKTAADSEAEIAFESGAVGSLQNNAEVSIKSAVTDNEKDDYETTLGLLKGKVLVNVKKIGSERLSFRVETPNAVAAVRGTEFLVDAESGDSTGVATFSGAVTVNKKGGTDSVIVNPNRELSINSKSPGLQKPIKLRKKTLELKKKFVELKRKAVIHRKSIELKRKTIKLKHKNLTIKDKEKIKPIDKDLGLKGKSKIK